MKRLADNGIPPKEMVVIIKPASSSNYNLLVKTLDEMSINEVKKYALAPLDADDEKLLAAAQ